MRVPGGRGYECRDGLETMIALSIKQPWASLIARGRKTIETRTWSTTYRGQLLICSGASPDVAALRRFGVTPAEWEDKCPPGVALAIVTLLDVTPMRPEDEAAACCSRYPGAFAWRFGPIVSKLAHPFPVRGQLGLFKVDLPKELWGSTVFTDQIKNTGESQ